ncbi:MAG: Ig domain-containing protein, partial [Acidobacteriota bacterium]|nr:Ig domain-containing protein [Acidobacteriota bacterium]
MMRPMRWSWLAVPLLATCAFGAVSVSTSSLGSGVVGAAYTANLGATGGVFPYTFSATGLPLGLGVNGSQITGTPTSSGTFSVMVTASDSATPPVSSPAKTLSLTINPAPLSVTTTSLGSGVVGTAYTANLGATGGVTPYTFSASGLPAGLMVTGNQITGTPNAAATSSVDITVTDSASPKNTATKTLPLTINPQALAVSTGSLAPGTVGSAYSALLGATGGVGAYTFSATGLPAGLGISGNQISGTPSAPGTFSVTVMVSDSAAPPNTATKILSLTINAPPLSITTTSLASGTLGSAYTALLGATGGTSPYTFSAGGLPAGLSVSGNQIIGTPSAAGSFTVTLQVRDSASPANTASKPVPLTINNTPVTVATSTLANGTVGSPYSATLTAAGGTGTYTFSLANGSLPTGLTLTGNLIAGTPTSAGTSSFTVKATDTANASGTQALTITINPAPVVLVTASLPNGTVGTAYLQSLSSTGGTGSYLYSLISGSLPAGLTLNGNQISGTPSSPGTANFSLKVADAANPNAFATQAFSITIFAGLTIAACPAATGTVGQAYSSGLGGSGGIPPYLWSLGGGQLPPGLAIDGTSGQIGGLPTQAGSFGFNIKLTDKGGSSANQNCSIAVAAALTVGMGALPDGSQGANYSQTLSASGGQPPYTWSVAGGSLPPGLSLGSGGQLAGVPSAAGSFAFTLRVMDQTFGSATGDFSIRIASGLSIGSCPTATALPNQAYSSILTGAGGQPPYTFSIAGQLPAGLTLDARTGAILGTPTQSGAVSFTIVLADSTTSSVTKPCSITVSQAVVINSTSLPSTTAGALYSQQVTASGGTPPYTWSIAAGALPPGLTLNTAGQISGTAASSGTFQFVVRASDSAGGVANANLSIQVAGSISIGTCPAPIAVAGQGYNGLFSVNGGQPPYTFSISSGLLPAGIRLNSILGTLSGTPVDLGNYNYSVQALDKTGAQATISCSLQVTGGLAISNTFVADATLRSPYSQTLQAIGGQPPYSWSIATGALPAGLSLNISSGLIAGTPSAAGTF